MTDFRLVDENGVDVELARTADVAAVTSSLGSDGPTPPALTGTGVRGWLRALLERLTDGTQLTRLTNGTTTANVEAFGALRVNADFQTLFYESWSVSPIDTTTKWTVTGTAPTIAGGIMTMPTTASSYHAIRTKDLIRPNNGFTHVRNGIRLEQTAATGAGRFWGLGTPATTPTATRLVQDGVGFEIDQASGNLLAVTYAAGVRTVVATLTRPTDGQIHAYGLHFRVTRAYWFVDNMQVPVAEAAFPDVQTVELPSLIVRQNAASFTGTPVFANIASLTADTAKQSTIIGDPVVGTRMGRVGPLGHQAVTGAIGTYGGQAGTAGTVNVPAGAQVRSYAAQSGTVPASITVPGVTGTITVPGSNQASTQFSDTLDGGTMVGPCTFIFSNTASYVVIWVLVTP